VGRIIVHAVPVGIIVHAGARDRLMLNAAGTRVTSAAPKTLAASYLGGCASGEQAVAL